MPSSGNPTWQDSPSTATPITAARLNAIEAALTRGVDVNLVDAKGDLLAGSAADVLVRVPAGTNGQVLTADSAQPSGVAWVTPAVSSTANAIDKTIFDAKGDLVVASGADAYVRVALGTNGYALIADSTQAGGVKWGPIPGQPTYGTALPGSPSDGQEHILVDSTTNPSYQWRFRYNATSSSTYKWEFVGGAEYEANVQTNQALTTNGSGWQALATAGPAVTAPYPGDYLVQFGAAGATVDNMCELGVNLNGSNPATDDVVIIDGAGNNTHFNTSSRSLKKTFASATTIVTVVYRRVSTGSSSTNFKHRWVTLKPIRISA